MSTNLSTAVSELAGVASQKNPAPGILDWVLVFGLCMVLIFAVMAFGAVEAWSSFGLEAGVVTLLLVWVTYRTLVADIRGCLQRKWWADPNWGRMLQLGRFRNGKSGR
jgi:hypothetical protein